MIVMMFSIFCVFIIFYWWQLKKKFYVRIRISLIKPSLITQTMIILSKISLTRIKINLTLLNPGVNENTWYVSQCLKATQGCKQTGTCTNCKRN